MQWKSESAKVWLTRVGHWHHRFAWFPVRVSDTEIVWLQWVERMITPVNDGYGGLYYTHRKVGADSGFTKYVSPD